MFAVQNTWEAGVEKEEEQGKRVAKIARDKGVQHFVYTSVGSADEGTGIPHFENKFRVEQTIKQLGFPSHVILRPVFFMENLPSAWFLNGDKLTTALKPETKLQMVAVDDVGKFSAKAFTDADKLKGAEIDYAGDAVTMAGGGRGAQRADGQDRHVSADSDRGRARRTARTSRRCSSGSTPAATPPTSRRWNRAGASARRRSSSGFAPRRAERGAARRRLRHADRPAVRFS